MNKKHSILPLIVIVLYLLTISGGVRYENKLTTFSNVFTPLLEQMMQAQTEEEVDCFFDHCKYSLFPFCIGSAIMHGTV